MICSQCGSENRDGAKFCDECGRPLLPEIAPLPDAAAVGGAASDADRTQELEAVETDGGAAALDGLEPPAVAPFWSGPLDRAKLPQIEVVGVNVDEHGDPYEPALDDEGASPDDDADDARMGASAEEAACGAEELAAGTDAPRATARSDDDDEDDEELPLAEPAVDLRGFDECLVEPGYVPPRASWNSGDTMEMPRIGDDAASAPRRDFRAPDPNEKRGLFRKSDAAKKQNASERAQKQSQKRERQEQKQAQKQERQAQKQKAPKRSGGVRAALLVAVCLIAVGVAAAGLTYRLEMWGGKTVPDVVGLTQADAVFMLESKGFAVRETKVKSDETEGLVLMVDPGVGSRVSAGSEVVIHVSQSRSIPNVVGMQRDEALALLEEEGFERVTVDTQKSDEQEGLVVGVTPAAGEKAKAITDIAITVTAPYCVPDVAGLSWDDAVAAIEGEGYSYDVAYVYDDSVAEGSVLGTDPAAGEKLPSGSVVVVQLAKSRGAELEAAAMSYLQGAGSITLGGVSYAITSVDAVAYEGGDTTSFTVTCAAVTVLDGETVYGSSKQKSGVIVWDAANNIVSVS